MQFMEKVDQPIFVTHFPLAIKAFYTKEDPNMPGEIMVMIEFKKVSCGTELTVVQEGLPAVIPTEMCYLGWQESLLLLAKLVEPDIK